MPASVHSDAYSSVVAYLIELRRAQGVQQTELARRLGKPQQFISKVENKLRRLDVVEFCAYVRALGADPEQAAAEVFRGLPKDLQI